MGTDELDLRVRMAVYGHIAGTGRAPSCDETARVTGTDAGAVRASWRRLRARRVLVIGEDGDSIRMAPPFSGVPTRHVVRSGGVTYFANCAWDALGIPAALHRAAVVESSCAQSGAPLRLEVGRDGPPPSDWLFHCLVPAAHWWDDIVFT